MPTNHDRDFNHATPDVEEATAVATTAATPSASGSPAEEASPAADVNLEDAFGQLFKSSVSGTGEEELLRIASDYALQIKASQFRLLLYLKHKASAFELASRYSTGGRKLQFEYAASYLRQFVMDWLEYKKHNNSDVFVMRALDSISLRKFINENTLKVNIEK